MDSLYIILLIIGFAALLLAHARWQHHRRTKRRDSLRRDDNSGVYLWFDLSGRPQQSTQDPRKDGGHWDIEDAAAADGGGDGDGGGGGGD